MATWVRKGLDIARLPRVKLNNIQDLPGAKKKVCTYCRCTRVKWLVCMCASIRSPCGKIIDLSHNYFGRPFLVSDCLQYATWRQESVMAS